MTDNKWRELSNEVYIFEGNCDECGRSNPVNKNRRCRFCNEVVGYLKEKND